MSGDDVVERSDDLDDRIGRSKEIQALVRSSRRDWLVIRALVVSVILDIVLSIGLGIVAFQARTAAELGSSVKYQQYQTCEVSNESRAGQRQLWAYILQATQQSANQTPAQKAQAQQFIDYVNKLYAPLTCRRPS